jgi:hypothetical protein
MALRRGLTAPTTAAAEEKERSQSNRVDLESRRPYPPACLPGLGGANEILSLQRFVGNRVVSNLLGRQQEVIRRHRGETSADALLATASSGGGGLARLIANGPGLPQILQTLLTEIGQSRDSVRDIIMNALRPAMKMRQSLDFQSNVTAAPGATKSTEKALRDWASSSGDYAFDIDIPGMHEFMAELFVLIAQNHTSPTGAKLTTLNELDLFHAHVVPSERTRDLAVIFHAKEYPIGEINPYKEATNRDAGLLRGGTPSFPQDDQTMSERNFLWTLRGNKIFVVADPKRTGHSADPQFASMIARGGDVGQLDAAGRQVGTVWESNFGQDLMNLNYFPNHLKAKGGGSGAQGQLFFTPTGQWGAVMMFENKYPHIDPKTIRSVYASTNDSAPKTDAILQTMSGPLQSPQMAQSPPPQAQPPPSAATPAFRYAAELGLLISMGFDPVKSQTALLLENGNTTEAVNLILTGVV